MSIVANLPIPRGLAGRKLAAATASITGSGAVTTGLSTIVTGGASATVQNSSGAAITSNTGPAVASIVSISGGTVTVTVADLFTTPAQSAAARTVGVIAIGN